VAARLRDEEDVAVRAEAGGEDRVALDPLELLPGWDEGTSM
jgi:hypothetical protein